MDQIRITWGHEDLSPIAQEGWILLVDPGSLKSMMQDSIVRSGDYRALPTINSWDRVYACMVVRLASGKPEMLNRPGISRAENCHQWLWEPEKMQATDVSLFVLDLLYTFHDDLLQVTERMRLLGVCIVQSERPDDQAGVIVSMYPPVI